MLAIKLRPVGKKKQISYRVVVMEKKSKLVGKFIEDLGWYNPHTNLCSLKNERVQYWIKSGAQPTDTVHNILIKEKIQEGTKIAKHGKSKKKEEQATTLPAQAGDKGHAAEAKAETAAEQPVETPAAEPPKEEEKAEEKPAEEAKEETKSE